MKILSDAEYYDLEATKRAYYDLYYKTYKSYKIISVSEYNKLIDIARKYDLEQVKKQFGLPEEEN